MILNCQAIFLSRVEKVTMWNDRCLEHLLLVTGATLAQQEAINVGYLGRNGKADVISLYDLFGDIFFPLY